VPVSVGSDVRDDHSLGRRGNGSFSAYGGGLSWILSIFARERLRNFCLFFHSTWLAANSRI